MDFALGNESTVLAEAVRAMNLLLALFVVWIAGVLIDHYFGPRISGLYGLVVITMLVVYYWPAIMREWEKIKEVTR
jgi:hypothetical protein